MPDTNDSMLYDYLITMGAMNPEIEQMKKKQAQVDALRGAKMGEGQMVGSGQFQHYVPKGIGGAIGALGQMAAGAYGQKQVDAGNAALNQRQADELKKLRERMMAGRGGTAFSAGVDTASPDAFMADFSGR